MSKSVEERCAGATRIDSHSKGVGEKLVFEGVPYSLSGACLEELSGLDSGHKHPLKGAVYCTDNDEETFTITVYTNELDGSLPEAFARWHMRHEFMPYASVDSRVLLDRK